METTKNYTDKKEQVFLCIDNKGFLMRKRPLNAPEKQQMYLDYPLVIQTGYRSHYSVKVLFDDNSSRCINPSKFKINKSYFFSRKPINTISLENLEDSKVN